MKRHFIQETIPIENKHIKDVHHQEPLEKLYHCLSIRIAKIKNCDNTWCWQGYVETGLFIHFWWGCKMLQPLWKKLDNFINTKHTLRPRNHTPERLPQINENMWSLKDLHIIVHSNFNHNSPNLETTKMFCNRLMEKRTVVYSCHGMLPVNTKTKTSIDVRMIYIWRALYWRKLNLKRQHTVWIHYLTLIKW